MNLISPQGQYKTKEQVNPYSINLSLDAQAPICRARFCQRFLQLQIRTLVRCLGEFTSIIIDNP